jgi:predicted DNA-binding transcriptional regulator AlpA
MSDDKQLVDLKRMARMLGIHPDTLRDMHLRGVIPSCRIGTKLLRFDPAEVREAIRQNNFNEKNRKKLGHL